MDTEPTEGQGFREHIGMGSGVGTTSTQTPREKESGVVTAIRQLDEALDRLNALTVKMTERLLNVLLAEPPEEVPGGATEGRAMSPLAAKIADRARTLHLKCGEIESLAYRLDI